MTSKEAAEKLKAELEAAGLSRREWYRNVYLNSVHWKDLRNRALEHHGRQCNRCPSTLVLQVHHLKYRSIYDVNVEDLEILCYKCHCAEHDAPKMRKKKPKKRKQKTPPRVKPKKIKSVNKPRSWTPKMVEDEIDKWKHSFRKHATPEASAIAHVLRTRGWFIPDEERRKLKERKKSILEKGHPMISEATSLEMSFRYVTGPF